MMNDEYLYQVETKMEQKYKPIQREPGGKDNDKSAETSILGLRTARP